MLPSIRDDKMKLENEMKELVGEAQDSSSLFFKN